MLGPAAMMIRRTDRMADHPEHFDLEISVMPSNDKVEAKISCKCGVCELTLADGRSTVSFLCGCEDCRQALQWGFKNGGVKPDPLPRLYYMRSDITEVKGRDKMIAVKLRADGRSTRVYCTSCYSILGVDHPGYRDNIFLTFAKHCINTGDLTVPLTAMVQMIDYSERIGPLPAEEVPVFHTFRFPQERARWLSIPAIANAFREPTEPTKGITMSALIESLGPPLMLNLEKGKDLLS
jgi:hypothetical protein